MDDDDDYEFDSRSPEERREEFLREKAIISKMMPPEIPGPISPPLKKEVYKYEEEKAMNLFKSYQECLENNKKRHPAVICSDSARKFNEQRSRLEKLYVLYEKGV